MKNHLFFHRASALLLLLSLCMGLFSCNWFAVENDTEEVSATETEVASSEEAVKEDPIKTYRCSYLPLAVREKLEPLFEKESALTLYPFTKEDAPYALQDVFTLCGCRLLSVTVPLFYAGTADANGDVSLTMYVINNTRSGITSQPLRSYELKINLAKNGLTENAHAGKWITVDLSALDITLAEDESVAFYEGGDTAIPGYILNDDNSVRYYLTDAFPSMVGAFRNVGSEKFGFAFYTLPFDFTYEYTCAESQRRMTYEEERAEYEALVEAVKAKYQGKYLSVLGDSISTFGGYSDNPANNRVTGSNPYYRADGSHLISHEFTYWGRLMRDAEMRLCVNNAWGGAQVFGANKHNGQDASYIRCSYLFNENGTPDNRTDDIDPDVILFYMGINDIASTPWGELCQMLKDTPREKWKPMLDEWMAALLQETKNGTDIQRNVNCTSLEAAYALTLRKMTQRYPNADIYCLNLLPNKTANDVTIQWANLFISALAEYFGVTLVDQYGESGINEKNHHAYMDDIKIVHPNAAGFYRMTKTVLKTMLKED